MSIVALIFIVVLFLVIISLLMSEQGKELRDYISFFTSGIDAGFKPEQLFYLGKIGRGLKFEQLSLIFKYLSHLDRCISEIVLRSRQTGSENDPVTQHLLSRLYKVRTKIELDQSQKKHGLTSTREINPGQRIRILLRGTGVFSSRVIKNGSRSITIEYPVGTANRPATSIDWVGRSVNVYFWRQSDAGYVFDTVFIADPAFTGKAILQLAHSNNLVRSQKRKSIRVKCSIYAQMYLIKPGETIDNLLEPEPGMKCLLEDLSEDGAMVMIGGKAVKNIRMKLQFMIHDVLIVMAGTVRAVEFNKETKQSRIHFDSTELNPRMKNAILTFVYNVLPEEEKEELDAIRLTEEDGKDESGPNGKNVPDSRIDTVSELPEMPDFLGK